MEKISCTVEILTRNNEKTLEQCLESVKDFGEIIVLDGNSTDRTLEIAWKFGCRVLKQYDTDEPLVRITDFAEVRNKGLTASTHLWFLFIDSDEYLSPEAVAEIRTIVADPNPRVRVWWQPRKYVVEGKVIDAAMTYPTRQIRFFHREAVEEFIKPIHERIKVRSGEVIGQLKSFEYVPMPEYGELVKKWQRYQSMEEARIRGASRGRLFGYSLEQGKVFLLYSFRLTQNILLVRPNRMPICYELLRLRYHLQFMVRLMNAAIFL